MVALSAAGSDQVIPKAVYDTFQFLKICEDEGEGIIWWQQQQLAIAFAPNKTQDTRLMNQPKEYPISGIMIGEVLRKLVEEDGMTILLVEQYVDFVKKYADSFAVGLWSICGPRCWLTN